MHILHLLIIYLAYTNSIELSLPSEQTLHENKLRREIPNRFREPDKAYNNKNLPKVIPKSLLTSYYNDMYQWVLGNEFESHASACSREGLVPTERIIRLNWNQSTVSQLAFDLGYQSINKTYGCCASSLWCTKTRGNVCYTQSYGSFYENFGWMVSNTTDYPVFTCKYKNNATLVSNPPQVTSVSMLPPYWSSDYSIQAVTVKGNNFGIEENITTASIAGQECNEIEICNHICSECDKQGGCPSDSECLGVNGDYRCFQYCAGSFDKSCPCGTHCSSVNVNTYYYGLIHLHLCTPEIFELSGQGNDICENFEQDQLLCKSPHAKQALFVGNLMNFNYSLTIGEETALGSLGSISQFICLEHSDCDDLNICTQDACNQSGYCEFIPLPDCQTVSATVRERKTNSYYKVYVESKSTSQQTSFDTKISQIGILSTVSYFDDYPIQYIDFKSMVFPFYGTIVKSIAINPNAVIVLPPIKPCVSYIGYITCIVYSTFTNSIPLWEKDWDLSEAGKVYYYEQSSGEVIDGITAQAFHVSFQDVVLYSEDHIPLKNESSFSISLYFDGSIRMRYSKIKEKLTSSDFAGLWSSRVSSNPLQAVDDEYKVNMTYAITEGNDVIYCPNFNTVTCVENTCLSPGEVYAINLPRPISCVALGKTLNITCRWVGGLVVLPADISPDKKRISCTVPTLPSYYFDTVVNLDINSEDYGLMNVLGVDLGFYSVTNSSLSSVTQKTQIMIKYVQSPSYCGCNPLLSYSNLKCDKCSVCGGIGVSVDCHGDCFGSAFIDTCGTCAGGFTGIVPNDQCDGYEALPDNNSLFLIREMFYLLIAVFALIVSVSLCLCAVRRNMDIRRLRIITLIAQGRAVVENDRRGLLPEEISTFNEFTISTDENDPVTNNECSICLSEFITGEICRKLPEPCAHTFHKKCIDEWLQLSSACPLCKRSLRGIMAMANNNNNNNDSTTMLVTTINPSYPMETAVSPMAITQTNDSSPSHRSIELTTYQPVNSNNNNNNNNNLDV